MTKNKKTICIIDDDKGILEAIEFLLKDEGYATQIINDSRSIKQLQENIPDLILLDIWMSGIDGRDVYEKLKENAKTKRIPIVIISAHRHIKEISQELGAESFIEKPFSMQVLLQTVVANL